jgi:predicted O-methyltransferase YrrM
MNRLASAVVYPARMAVRTGRRVLRTLLFDRVVERMKRTGPVEDLDVLVDLAMRGYWNAITPIQNRQEILTLLRILKPLRPRRILEIGTASGGTLFLFTRVAAPDALLMSVDLPGGAGGGGYPPWKIPLYRGFALPDQRLELIRDDSHDPAVLSRVAAIVGPAGLDLLFIDGDHSYDGVHSDFAMYGPLVKPDGLIAFHDIDYSDDVRRFWDEVKVGRRFREIRGGGGQTYGIGVIYSEVGRG